MKKQVSIFFSVIISIYFACSALYAYQVFQANIKNQALAGNTATGQMQFEAADGTEDLNPTMDTDFPSLFTFSFSSLHVFSNELYTGCVKKENFIIKPLYISNQVFLI